MPIPQHAALYCRISKTNTEQDESNSIHHQKMLLPKSATHYGYDRTQFYIDDGYSGTVFTRPLLMRLEEDICAGIISAVLVKDISRLGRDYRRIGYYLEDFFPQHNVRFIAVSGGIDSNTNSSDFVPLYSVMDEWYARDISRKLRLMYQSRAASGIPIGAPIYGYMRAADNPKFWDIDSKAAEIVRHIYQLAFYGYGTEQIARILEIKQVLTPSHYNQQNGGNRTTKSDTYHWSATTVSKILRDQRYCGDVVNLKTYSNSYKDKKRHENTKDKMIILKDVHPPIIERSLWEYIQDKLNSQKARKRAGEPSLFSGFLRCGDCGSNMHYHFNQANPKIEYYKCSNYKGNRGTCPNTHYVRLDVLTKLVIEELNILLKAARNPFFWDRLMRQKSEDMKIEVQHLTEEIAALHNRLEELSKALSASYEDKMKGMIDDETFVVLAQAFKKERKQLREQESHAQETLRRTQDFQNRFTQFKASVVDQPKIKQLSRDIVGGFIDYIAVYTADRSMKSHAQRIDIYYHFIGRVDMDKIIRR